MPSRKSTAAQLGHAQEALVARPALGTTELEHPVRHRELDRGVGLALVVLADQDRGGVVGPEHAGGLEQDSAPPRPIGDDVSDRLEGVDDDDPRPVALDQLQQLGGQLTGILFELVVEAVEHDLGANALDVDELELLQECQQLRRRLGQGRQVERGTFRRRVVERDLLGERGLAAPGHSREDVHGIARQAAGENPIEAVDAGRDPLHQLCSLAREARCWRNNIRTESTSLVSLSGLRRKASAPASRARSSAARMLKIRTATSRVSGIRLQCPAHAQSVEPGDEDLAHQDRRVGGASALQRGAPVGHEVDRESGLFEEVALERAHVGVAFDHQNQRPPPFDQNLPLQLPLACAGRSRTKPRRYHRRARGGLRCSAGTSLR